jgi:flagellin-like protein
MSLCPSYILNKLWGGTKVKMKILRSGKALSPVIASIILIAVTVALSIAVAAWMGALTFSFTNTEQITYTGYTWAAGDKNVTLTVQNTGASTLSIANVEVDRSTATNVKIGGATWTYGTSVQLTKGRTTTIVIAQTFTSGVQYNFMVVTARGNQFGPYALTAP